jgi:rubrerythrin
MSENLKRLRKEAYITDKGRKWTPEEEAKRIARERKKEYAGLSYLQARYEDLSGMSKIEELERKNEETRKEEQRVKEEMSETAKKAVKMIMSDLDTMIKDEERAVSMYDFLLKLYGTVGWRKIFFDILSDEKEHLEKLKIAKKAVEDEIKKYI